MYKTLLNTGRVECVATQKLCLNGVGFLQTNDTMVRGCHVLLRVHFIHFISFIVVSFIFEFLFISNKETIEQYIKQRTNRKIHKELYKKETTRE
jgi:hypothetical protein